MYSTLYLNSPKYGMSGWLNAITQKESRASRESRVKTTMKIGHAAMAAKAMRQSKAGIGKWLFLFLRFLISLLLLSFLIVHVNEDISSKPVGKPKGKKKINDRVG